MAIARITKKRPMPAKELAEAYGVSLRTIQRYVSQPREDYLADQAKLREEIRAYHDDAGHSWAKTAERFEMSISAVRQRAYRARKDREEQRSQG